MNELVRTFDRMGIAWNMNAEGTGGTGISASTHPLEGILRRRDLSDVKTRCIVGEEARPLRSLCGLWMSSLNSVWSCELESLPCSPTGPWSVFADHSNIVARSVGMPGERLRSETRSDNTISGICSVHTKGDVQRVLP